MKKSFELNTIKNLIPTVKTIIESVEAIVPTINDTLQTCEETKFSYSDGKEFTENVTNKVEALSKCIGTALSHDTVLENTMSGIITTITDMDTKVVQILNTLFGKETTMSKVTETVKNLIPKEIKGEIPNTIDECISIKDYAYYAISDNGSIKDVVKKAAGKWSKDSFEKFLVTYAQAKGADLDSDSYKEFHDKWMTAFDTRSEKVKAKQNIEVETTEAVESNVTGNPDVLMHTLTANGEVSGIDFSKIHCNTNSKIKSSHPVSALPYTIVKNGEPTDKVGVISESEYYLMIATVAGEAGGCGLDNSYGVASALLNACEGQRGGDMQATLEKNCWRFGKGYKKYVTDAGVPYAGTADKEAWQNAKKAVDTALSGTRAFESDVQFWVGNWSYLYNNGYDLSLCENRFSTTSNESSRFV